MAKRKAKKPASKDTACAATEDVPAEKEPKSFQEPDVERWSATMRASRDLDIDNLRTSLQLLRSYFNEEQLQTPLLQFFEKNLPNFTIVKREDGSLEAERKGSNVGNSSMNQEYDLHQMSSFTGLELMSELAKANNLCGDNLQINDCMLGEPSESQLLGFQDALRTPGANIQRLSIGTTPNTVRLPKHGEMLVSVRGSPLGVYNKQDNMEAINESEEG